MGFYCADENQDIARGKPLVAVQMGYPSDGKSTTVKEMRISYKLKYLMAQMEIEPE